MTRLIDMTAEDWRADRIGLPRHPEKAHRPDQPVARKPPWIRVRAPGSPVYVFATATIGGHQYSSNTVFTAG